MKFKLFIFNSMIISFVFYSGCTASTTNLAIVASQSPSPSASASATTASGARAAKFIFTQSTSGSFDAPSSTGTVPSPGSGLQATRVFNADGTLLASGTTSSSWPAWIPSFEIGISGSSNTSAVNPNCANFASSTEKTTSNCLLGGSLQSCGADAGLFRVSEVDCVVNGTTGSNGSGNGGPNDGVYFRAQFSRTSTNLGTSENILVVIEYSAASYNRAASNPTNCYVSGNGFAPENCSDYVWKAYLKHTSSEIVQPFLLLVPPFFSSVVSAGTTTTQNATVPTAKQFIIPLAGDSSLTYLQISRTSNFPSASLAGLQTACANSGLPGNTPLCAGVIFYSITFYRI